VAASVTIYRAHEAAKHAQKLMEVGLLPIPRTAQHIVKEVGYNFPDYYIELTFRDTPDNIRRWWHACSGFDRAKDLRSFPHPLPSKYDEGYIVRSLDRSAQRVPTAQVEFRKISSNSEMVSVSITW
jgi:hypothetical protein